MRVLSTLAAIALFPAAAMAQSISPDTLKQNEAACYERCVQNKSAEVCRSACSCMTQEMGQYWNAKTYDERSARWQKDAKDAELNKMMNEMAMYCMNKARRESR